MLTFLLYAGVFIIISTMLVMHLTLKKLNRPKLSILPKCTGSFLFVWLVLMAYVQHGENPFGSLLFWFLVVCTIADGVIGVHFIAGMAIFGVAHIYLIIWSLQQAPFSPVSAAVWAAVMLAMAFLFRNMLRKMGKQSIAFVGYAGILVADFAISLPLFVTAGPAYILLPIGTLLFLVSDGFIGMELIDKRPWQQYAIMTLYWGSLYLISLVPWIIL